MWLGAARISSYMVAAIVKMVWLGDCRNNELIGGGK